MNKLRQKIYDFLIKLREKMEKKEAETIQRIIKKKIQKNV
jgi:hypothetical protein